MLLNRFKKVTPMSLINGFLNQVTWVGYNPMNRPKLNYTIGILLMLYIIITFILCGVNILANPYTDFKIIMIDITLFNGYWQLTAKIVTIFNKQRALSKLFDIVNYKFWSLDILSPSERPKIQRVYDITRLATRSYEICMMTTLFGHFITSYLRGKESLINSIWIPDTLKEWNRSFLGHISFYVIQGVLMYIAIVVCLIVLDGLYIVLISLVVAELRILKYRLLTIDGTRSVNENMKELIKCVEHHNLLFDFLYTIEEIFSTELLHVAGSIIVIAVFAMYCCMIENDIGRVIVYTFMFIAVLIQLFIYCFMGQLIQDESRSVADAAYLCNWEEIPNKNVRISLVLIILRSQKHFSITMGGLLILCLETFTRVSRMMLSLLTFMMNFDVGK